MARVANALVLLLVLVVGGVLLQIFLSRRESRWPGLVLPGICLLFSIIMVLNVAAMDNGMGMAIVTMLMVFCLGNISTLVLLAIYAACRGGRKKQREMEKMNICDL